MKNRLLCLVMFAASLTYLSCNDDDKESKDPLPAVSKSFSLSFNNLPVLQGGAFYQAWIIIDGEAISAGKFRTDATNNILDLEGNIISDGKFDLETDLSQATQAIITIEPAGDTDEAPSSTKILGGAADGTPINLTIDHSSALGSDFRNAAGTYVLKTPSDGDGPLVAINERSGIWYLSSFDPPTQGLDLPTLPAGWQYEGWALLEGFSLTTGTFTDPSVADNASPYSNGGPPFPGEDFLSNPPDGLTFPTDLRGNAAAITIEPDPDDSPEPFSFKVLSAQIANDADSSVIYPLENQSVTLRNTAGKVVVE